MGEGCHTEASVGGFGEHWTDLLKLISSMQDFSGPFTMWEEEKSSEAEGPSTGRAFRDCRNMSLLTKPFYTRTPHVGDKSS